MLSHISLSLNIAAASLTNFRCKLHNDIVKNDDATQTVISVNCWRSGPNYLRKLVPLTLHWNARRHIAAAVSRERRTENSARESTDAVERGPKSLTCSSKTINLQLGFTWMAKLLPSCARPPGGPRAHCTLFVWLTYTPGLLRKATAAPTVNSQIWYARNVG